MITTQRITDEICLNLLPAAFNYPPTQVCSHHLVSQFAAAWGACVTSRVLSPGKHVQASNDQHSFNALCLLIWSAWLQWMPNMIPEISSGLELGWFSSNYLGACSTTHGLFTHGLCNLFTVWSNNLTKALLVWPHLVPASHLGGSIKITPNIPPYIILQLGKLHLSEHFICYSMWEYFMKKHT